jgi:hypothetical protein
VANITESTPAVYTAGIYQIEDGDPATGGPAGITVLPAKQLADRTKWLKEQVDALLIDPKAPILTLYIDSIGGDDSNDGESDETPYETLDAALERVIPGTATTLWLARDGSYTWGVQVEAQVAYLSLNGDWAPTYRTPATGTAQVTQQAAVVSSKNRTYGMMGLGCHLALRAVTFTTATKANGAYPWDVGFNGLLTNVNPGATLELLNSQVHLMDANLATVRNTNEINLHGLTLTREAGKTSLLIALNSGVVMLKAENVLFPVAAQTLADWMSGIVRAPDGTPTNLICNLQV